MTRIKEKRTKTVVFLRKHPLASFFIALAVLFGVIATNSLLSEKPAEEVTETQVKTVSTYKIGSAPKITLSGRIEKEGVIQIVALTPGIVSSVNATEGRVVPKGTTLVSLSTNYQGGNALSVQSQIAQKQFENVKDTYNVQKDLISKQRELAEKNRDNSEKLREITDKSLDETRDLISLNESIITSLQNQLQAETPGTPAYVGIQQQISQFQSATNQIRQGLRNAEFQAGTDNPPKKLTDLQNDIAQKQLDLQLKALDLNKETSKLQKVLAQIIAATMYPAAPFESTVEKVHVTVGQSVNPGTPLVTIAATSEQATLTVNVPHSIAGNISHIEDSILYVAGKKYLLLPQYVSKEATSGQLNSVVYTLPQEAYEDTVDGQYIQIEIPVGYADTITTVPYVPIDIVYQTQNGAFVTVFEKDSAVSRKVELGEVVGHYVAILAGLKQGDLIILDRTIVAGQKVRESN